MTTAKWSSPSRLAAGSDPVSRLLRGVTGMPYRELFGAIDALSREQREPLNTLAGEIIDDARSMALTSP